MIALDALPSKSTVVDPHSALLAELNSFNAETLAIRSEGAVVDEQVRQFEKAGLALEALLRAGPENLSTEQRRAYIVAVRETEIFQGQLKRRIDALNERAEIHAKRERELMARLRKMNLLAGPLPQTLSNN